MLVKELLPCILGPVIIIATTYFIINDLKAYIFIILSVFPIILIQCIIIAYTIHKYWEWDKNTIVKYNSDSCMIEYKNPNMSPNTIYFNTKDIDYWYRINLALTVSDLYYSELHINQKKIIKISSFIDLSVIEDEFKKQKEIDNRFSFNILLH
ncbi:MAG: hypothetical protein IJ756_09035 [Paludibacteraceae bacterium]|nr:hypothetical protein [Paludibacteraceae bacterium]